MKATGIIRRIDELGRIVIPKEIRKNLRIKVGENLEIYVDSDENIVLKKFSIMNKITDLSQELTDAIYSFVRHNVVITDNNKIIAASGKIKKEYINQPISNNVEEMINRRESLFQNHFKDIEVVDSKSITCSYVSKAILVDGEAIGVIIIFSMDEKVLESDMTIAEIVSSFMTKYLEE